MKFPFLYKPPKGTPPTAAAVSSTKFKDCDTAVNTIHKFEYRVLLQFPVILDPIANEFVTLIIFPHPPNTA